MVQQELPVRVVLMVLLEHQVELDHKETKVHKVQLDRMELPVHQALQALL